MNFPTTTRQFFPAEQRILKSLLSKATKEANSKAKYYHLLIAGCIAVACSYLASIIKIDFLFFVFGTLAVIACASIVIMPYEIYKDKKRIKNFIRTLQFFLDKGTVDTFQIKSSRIAFAQESEDESDLYIVELDEDKVLYLWDIEYNLYKKFPCLNFEIYEDNFFKLTGRQIHPLSDKIQPIKVDMKAVSNYSGQYGGLGHLETENINFDKLLEKINSSG